MLYVGVMTGTSIDGLDVALLDVGEAGGDGSPTALRIAAFDIRPIPIDLVRSLRALAASQADDVEHLGRADAALGDCIGDAVVSSLDAWGVGRNAVRAIGSHGQTIRHRPNAETAFTMQIGDPSRIAERTGIATVADFRRRDVAAGGQGAPLAPLFHAALFRHPERSRVVLNIGGIANATFLPPGPSSESASAAGFDTGPGNALMDAWAQHCLQRPFDRGGAWAASGRVRDDLLAALMADPFLGRPPPKSTGKETYHLPYIEAACRGLDAAAADVQATLAEFTACSIAQAVAAHGPECGEVAVCGGGRRNRHLMGRLAARMAHLRICSTDALGIDGDGLEAAAFAWFAHRTLAGRPSNVPEATGAAGERILGAIYPA